MDTEKKIEVPTRNATTAFGAMLAALNALPPAEVIQSDAAKQLLAIELVRDEVKPLVMGLVGLATSAANKDEARKAETHAVEMAEMALTAAHEAELRALELEERKLQFAQKKYAFAKVQEADDRRGHDDVPSDLRNGARPWSADLDT